MNGKRIAAFAVLATLITSAPALAANPTITVKWNTQTISSIILTTQYDGAPVGTHKATAETIFANANTGSGTCSANDTEAATGTVNFGNVAPDAVQYTDCLEINAVNAAIQTNDNNGYSVSEAATAGYPASGFLLCLLPNGSYANNLAATASARAAAPSIVSTAACPGGDFIMNGTGATILPSTGANGSTTGTNLGGDIELVQAPNAPGGAQSVVITYTLTTN